MRQCGGAAWPEVAAAAVVWEFSMASGMEVMQRMLGLMMRVCAAGYRAWWEATEPEPEGEVLRFKTVSEKEFFTLCGPVVVSQRLFPSDRGGPSVSPWDEAWGMVRQCATPEIREIAAYSIGPASGALLPPQKTPFHQARGGGLNPRQTALRSRGCRDCGSPHVPSSRERRPGRKSIRRSHLVLFQAESSGIIRRAGAPWSGSSGSPS